MRSSLLLLVLLSSACNSWRHREPEPPHVSLLSFNVENLSETAHGAGKLDWTEQKFAEKLHRVATVIREAKAGCPDIVVLQEIADRAVLQRLRKIELADCGYDWSAIGDGGAPRGTVAMLSKFPIQRAETLSIPFVGMSAEHLRMARGVLSAWIEAPGKTLHVLDVHLPARFDPVKFRQAALKFLGALYRQDQTVATIMGGDWNVPAKEDRELQMFASLRTDFFVSDDEIRKTSADPGTTYYSPEKTWSFLDKILVSRNFVDHVACQVSKSLAVQSDQNSRPLSFPETTAPHTRLADQPGVSDHFPVLCQLTY